MAASEPSGRMTNRARVYMGIATGRHLVLGFMLVTAPQAFSGAVYDAVVDAIPLNGTPTDHLRIWGILMLITAAVISRAIFTANPQHARTGLTVSIGMTAALLSGLMVAIILPDYTLGGYSLFVLLGSLLLKDMSMLRDPLRNPFEEVAEVIRGHKTGTKATFKEVDIEIAQAKREWLERDEGGVN